MLTGVKDKFFGKLAFPNTSIENSCFTQLQCSRKGRLSGGKNLQRIAGAGYQERPVVLARCSSTTYLLEPWIVFFNIEEFNLLASQCEGLAFPFCKNTLQP